MTFLALRPLSFDRLSAALELDQRCFGGLWTLDGYQRELESPNSEFLVLIEEPEVRSQDSGQSRESGETLRSPSIAPQNPTQNSGLKRLHSSPPQPLIPSPLLGLGCYWSVLEEAHITMLAIDPAYQRRGLGQALLYALMHSAHKRGLERATLEVRISNRSALSLYQKFDFCEAGRRRRYYPDNGEDALVLWREGIQTPAFSACLEVWGQQVCDRLSEAQWELATNGEPSILSSQG